MSTSSFKKTGSFGSAKPLPGQAGYKESQTSLLEREALEMENRLKLLQERMQQQNEEEEKLKSNTKNTNSETRWGSASTKKGSVTSYAKDVHERHKKKSDTLKDPTQKATAAARRNQRQNLIQGGFANKDVDQWTVADVGEWLTSMMLQQHVQKFTLNAISGPILLDISLDDLDYMEVSILAHRKVILKGIEDLRQNKRVTKQLFAPTTSNTVSIQSVDDGNISDKNNSTKEQIILPSNDQSKPKAHWSTLEPLRMKEVTGDSGGYMVNGADSSGMLDEEAERRAFQEAVMQWRQGTSSQEKGGKSILIGGVESSSSHASQWSNPFSDNSVSSDKKKQQGVTSGVGMNDDDNNSDFVLVSARSNYNINDSDEDEHRPKNICLADGELNEEEERKKFQEAVNSWRSGTDQKSNKNKEIAGKLAEQMDAMHAASSAKLKEDQYNMIKRIQKAKDELDKAKSTLKKSTEVTRATDELESKSNDYEEHDRSRYGLRTSFHNEEDENDNNLLSPCPSMHDIDSEDERDHHSKSYVEVELIKSTVGLTSHKFEYQSSNYVVDEPSSDDDNEA